MFVLVLNSSNIVPDGYNNKLEYRFPNSVVLKDKYIAVSSISMYYSWFNIATTYTNNYFTYTWISGTTPTTYTINIPDGLYQVSDLNNLIQFECIKNGTYWTIAGVNYYPFELILNPPRYAVQLNTYYIPSTTTVPAGASTPPAGWPTTSFNSQVSFPANFYKLIGFAPIAGVDFISALNSGGGTVFPTPSANTYYATINASNTISYISNVSPNLQPNSNVLFSISNINNPYSQPSSIIYSLSPAVGIGEQIIERPPNFMWNKLIEGTYNTLRLTLLGTDLQPLNIKDPNMTILLTIRDKEEALLGTK